jgi:hypothetical protein
MIEIKFPSIVGIAEDGKVLVYDSKGKLRKLKRFNHETGRKQYIDKAYTGEVITYAQFSIPTDKVNTFEVWKPKRKK